MSEQDKTMKRETLTPAEQKPVKKPMTNTKTLTLIGLLVFGFFVGCYALGHFEYLLVNTWAHDARQLRNEAYKMHQQSTHQTSDDAPQQEARQQANEFQEKYYPSFAQALAQFQELAYYGCQAPFKECLQPFLAKQNVLDAMDREKIEFGTYGMTNTWLDQLQKWAEMRIAMQKFNYLTTKGGAKLPWDLKLLSHVCFHVYFKHQSIFEYNPTHTELKQLLPPGVTNVDYCYWPGWKEN